MRVAVVILNWNGRKLLERFLPSVTSCSAGEAVVVVADNASKDDSSQFLKQHYPEIRVVENQQNYGYAEGYNRTLKQMEAEYYVLLNSDVEVSRGWLTPCIALMDEFKDVGAVQPKIKSLTNPGYFEYAGAAGGFIDKYGYPFCRGRLFETLEKDEGQYDEQDDIFWATGACFFVRASLFHRLNGFDIDLFSHQEEIDLCWRMKLAGYRVMYCPKSEVFHYGGGMLPKTDPFKTYLNFRNNLIIIYKNHSTRHFLWVINCRLFLDAIAAIRFLLTGNGKDFIAIVKARHHFFKTLKLTRKKRELQKDLLNNHVSSIYKKSIVVKYFLKGKKRFSHLDRKDFS